MHKPATAAKFAAAATIANPLGARQESSRQGGPIDIVTAVRRFSESLLSSRVTKDVKQEVKALAAHMEILATRRHVAARRAKSPSAAETRVALRNLKRFLEREANREMARKRTSASCTTDTLESSSSHVQAFSPRSEITRDYEISAIAACGSRGDTQLNDSYKPPPSQPPPYQLSHGSIQQVRAQAPEVGKPELPDPPSVMPCSFSRQCQQQQEQSHRSRRLASRREPMQPRSSGAAAAQLIRLTCADKLRLLLLPVDAADHLHPDVHVHAVAHIPTETAAELKLQASEAAAAAAAATVTDQQYVVRHCLHSRSPARTERAPVVVSNSQLEAAAPSQLQVAVEKTLDLVLLTVDPSAVRGRQNDNNDNQTVQCSCHRCFCCCCWHSLEAAKTSDGGEAACQLRGKALVAEQGNFNCATGVSTRLSIVNDWARTGSAAKAAATFKQIEIATLETSNSKLAWNQSHQASSHQVCNQVSTCSCPSESDGLRRPSSDAESRRPPSDSKKAKDTEESVDLQSSSALIQQQQRHQAEPIRLGHVSIAASAIRLEQRVCESCSPEVLASSTSVLTVGDPPDWQQPIFGIVDLVQLTRLAARIERSDSPTEASLEVALRRRAGPRQTCNGGDSHSERSKSTLDVVDQSGTTAVAAAALASCTAAVAGGRTSTLTSNPAGVLGGGAITTWSSCELGQSSGFTKLLLTLDKAARRRREQMRARRRNKRPPPPPPLTDVVAVAARGRRTSRSGNNSVSHRPPRPAPPQPPPLASATVDAAEVILRQEEALKLAARSLSELAYSLQHCMRRVHSAAEAIKW